MRCIFACTAALLALTVPPGATAQQQLNSSNAMPPVAQQGPAQETPQQTPPSGSTQTEQQGVDRAIRSESGRAGTQEPSAASPAAEAQDKAAVFVNGALNVPGAPKDSQTVPAKFSERNATLDKLPTLGQPLGLTDAQRQTILESVRAANAPVEQRDAKVTEALSATFEAREFSQAIRSEIPALNNLKYVRLADKVLLIIPANHIVVDQIKN